jgi:VWFA-related protein
VPRSAKVSSLPRFTRWAFLGAICGSLTCFASAQTTPPQLTLHANVSEVRITFSTTDQNNRVIATIQPSDFAIVDQDLVVRDFRSFTRSEYTRLDVALLVDASASITPRLRQELSNALQVVDRSDGVPEDSFSVISFRDLKPAVVCEANCRSMSAGAKSAGANFPSITGGGPTPLYDSIVFAARRLGQQAGLHTRKIIVLYSDGADTISLRSLSDAIEAAFYNDVAIYSVDMSAAPHARPGTLVLRSLSVNTGGRYFSLESGSAKVLSAILEDFHATYTVAYKLPNHASGFHQVRILPTHDPGLQFHSRCGYYYPSNPEN